MVLEGSLFSTRLRYCLTKNSSKYFVSRIKFFVTLKNNVNTFIQNLPNEDEIHLHVITFNYTSVFERIFEYWDVLPLGKIKEYTLFHIHQKLD